MCSIDIDIFVKYDILKTHKKIPQNNAQHFTSYKIENFLQFSLNYVNHFMAYVYIYDTKQLANNV